MRWPARVKSGAFVTTTAGEDETSLGNPENNKRDAVDIATTVPAPEKTKQTAEPAPENKAAAEPTTAEPAMAEPTTSEPTTTELTTAEPAWRVPVVQEFGPSLTLGNPADVELSNVRPDRGPNGLLSMGPRVRRDATVYNLLSFVMPNCAVAFNRPCQTSYYLGTSSYQNWTWVRSVAVVGYSSGGASMERVRARDFPLLKLWVTWGAFVRFPWCHGLRLYPVCVCNTVRLGQDTTWNRQVHGLRVYPVCVCNTVRLELSRMDSVTIKPSHSIRCVYRADLILLQIVDWSSKEVCPTILINKSEDNLH